MKNHVGSVDNPTHKIVSLKYLASNAVNTRNCVLAGGAFDVLHRGHIEFLLAARQHGSKLIVHIASDKRLRDKKGLDRPYQNELDRATIIASLEVVSYVFIDDLPNYHLDIVSKIKPKCLFLYRQNHNSPAARAHLTKLQKITKLQMSDQPKINSTTTILHEIHKEN